MRGHSIFQIGIDLSGVPVRACFVCGLYEKPAKDYDCQCVIDINTTHKWIVNKEIYFELWGRDDWVGYKCAKCGIEFPALPGFTPCIMVECDLMMMRLALEI